MTNPIVEEPAAIERCALRLTIRIAPLIESACRELRVLSHRLRIGQLGRLVYVQLYCLVPAGASPPRLIDQDQLRARLYQSLVDRYPHLAMDVFFTADPVWAERAIRLALQTP